LLFFQGGVDLSPVALAILIVDGISRDPRHPSAVGELVELGGFRTLRDNFDLAVG
jgi:hypothetical protein